jgi:hypothetical protein
VAREKALPLPGASEDDYPVPEEWCCPLFHAVALNEWVILPPCRADARSPHQLQEREAPARATDGGCV